MKGAIMKTITSVLLSTALAGLSFSAMAQVGPEFQVNTYTQGPQDEPSVAVDATGDFVVVWQNYRGFGNVYSGISGQRFDASGVPQGSEFQVNSYTSLTQYDPSVGIQDDGQFVVVWRSDSGQDGSDRGVFGQRFNSTGDKMGAEFQVNTYTTGDQGFFRGGPSIAVDADGDFVVVWGSKGQDGDGDGVFGQRFNNAGVMVGSEFQVNSYTSGKQSEPSVAIDDGGNFVVVWTGGDFDSCCNQDGSRSGIFGQRFNDLGAKIGSEFQVNTITVFDQGRPSVAMDTDGDFVVVWQDNNTVRGQRFSNSGAMVDSEFEVKVVGGALALDGVDRAVALDDNGNFVVLWNGYSNPGVFGQKFGSSGAKLGSEFQVNTYTTGGQDSASIGRDDEGNFVVVWESNGQDGDRDGVFAALLIGAADLSVTKTADAAGVAVGEELTYTITVSNAGPGNATNVEVEDVLPEGMAYVSGVTTQGSGCVEDAGTVTCGLGTINNGSEATATIVVEILAPGSYENTATAGSDQGDADGAAGTSPAVAASAEVPTLDEWALLMLGLVLAMAGFVAIRR